MKTVETYIINSRVESKVVNLFHKKKTPNFYSAIRMIPCYESHFQNSWAFEIVYLSVLKILF